MNAHPANQRTMAAFLTRTHKQFEEETNAYRRNFVVKLVAKNAWL